MAMPYGQPANAPGPGEPERADEAGGERPGEDEGQTAFVPMEVFTKTPAIGDTCTFKVVDVSEDGDVELEYVSSSAGEKTSSGPTPPWDKPDEPEGDY